MVCLAGSVLFVCVRKNLFFIILNLAKSEPKSKTIGPGRTGAFQKGGGMQNGQNGQVPLLLPEIK